MTPTDKQPADRRATRRATRDSLIEEVVRLRHDRQLADHAWQVACAKLKTQQEEITSLRAQLNRAALADLDTREILDRP